MEDYYKLLGVEPNASAKEIGKAFRQKARQTHPDKLPPDSSEDAKLQAKQRFQQVAKAWEVLGDDQQRAAYDADRAAHRAQGTSRAEERFQRTGPRPSRAAPRESAEEAAAREKRAEAEARKKERAEARRQRQQEESDRQDRERDARGLGSHWVPPSSQAREATGPERSGGLGHWTGFSAAREAARYQDAKSDSSSELSFNIDIDLDDLDLTGAEKIFVNEVDEWDQSDEVWDIRRPAKDQQTAPELMPRPPPVQGPTPKVRRTLLKWDVVGETVLHAS